MEGSETRKIEWTAGPEEAGRRLDGVPAGREEGISRSYLQKLIGEGLVSLNGTVCTAKKTVLREGDRITVTVPPARSLEIDPEDIELKVVYEDEDLLVVDKPRGMVVHPAAGNAGGTLVNAVLHHCGNRLSSINGVVRPGIVHRIDKDTGGLLMVAKNDRAHVSLAAQLAAHTIVRRYRALVWDNIKEDRGTVDRPVGRDPKNRLRQAVLREGGKRAVTHYEVLRRFGRFTEIRAVLETGRTHQIRVHMAFLKHPLLGDTVYGPARQPFGLEGQMLHAELLGFVHPSTGAYMEFESPLPPVWEQVIRRIEEQKGARK